MYKIYKNISKLKISQISPICPNTLILLYLVAFYPIPRLSQSVPNNPKTILFPRCFKLCLHLHSCILE